MLRAGVGVSAATDGHAAGEEAAAAALEGLGRADAAVLLVGPGHAAALPRLLDAAVSALGTEAVVGASSHGVIAAGQEYEGSAAVAVLALAGLETHPFLIPDPSGDEAAACEEIAARIGGPGRAEDLVVLFPDPRTFSPQRLLPALSEALGPAQIVGAGAADPVAGAPQQWCGRALESGGIAGIVLRGSQPPRIGVTQACRPATGLLTVTRARGHWILELDGRPALDVYREVARGPLAEDLRRAASFVLAALPVKEGAEGLEPGSYRVRHVVGFEPEENAFALPESLKPGQRIALALREPESAREDLKAVLAKLGERPPALGLYFNCCARGASFFGVSGLEAAYLENAFGSAPLAGMFGSCEIGPIGGRTELLTYTGVLALLDG
jgi:small ligand-binding sensory domain FIST